MKPRTILALCISTILLYLCIAVPIVVAVPCVAWIMGRIKGRSEVTP